MPSSRSSDAVKLSATAFHLSSNWKSALNFQQKEIAIPSV
jgi:hypothetical protein